MDGKIWGYGAGETRPIPPISFLFRRFPENRNLPFVLEGEILVLWESPEEEGNWGYGAGEARPIPPYLSIHHGNSQRAEIFIPHNPRRNV